MKNLHQFPPIFSVYYDDEYIYIIIAIIINKKLLDIFVIIIYTIHTMLTLYTIASVRRRKKCI